MNKWGLEEIRAIRDRWADMPEDEVVAEKKILYARAKRKMAQIRIERERLALPEVRSGK